MYSMRIQHVRYGCHTVGQQPKRQKLREIAPDPDKARLLMGQYLSGSIPSPPWEAMGLSRPPVIAGKLFLCLFCWIHDHDVLNWNAKIDLNIEHHKSGFGPWTTSQFGRRPIW